MSGAAIVQVIAVLMALVLVLRAVRARGMAPRDALLMAAAWIAIIAVVAFVVQRSGMDAIWQQQR